MQLTYETIKTTGKDSQYGLVLFDDEHNTADAIYIDQKNPEYCGNILAAALPPQPDVEIIKANNIRGLPWFNYREQIQSDKQTQFLNINKISDIRFAMPFHFDLAASIHNAFMEAASNRYIVYDRDQNVIQHNQGQDNIQHCKSYGSTGGTTGSFILSGTAGTGKSTAIITALRYYPQIIIHHCEELPMFIQVLYVVAECPPNSNLSGLYISIAKAYDKALRNLDGYYETECVRRKGLDQKESFISELINRYHTLLVVVDEVQNIDFNRTKQGSIYSLMKLKNESKISMAFCGLYSACENLLRDYAMKRRAKVEINSNPYTDNKQYFAYMVHTLMGYQWFYPKVDISSMSTEDRNAFIDTLYTYTGGIVDQLLSLYKMMNYEYVRRSSRPDVNAAFVEEVSNKYFPGILTTLNNIHYSYEKQLERKKASSTAAQTITESIEKLERKETEKQIEDIISSSSVLETDKTCKRIVENIQNIFPEYSYDVISSAFYKLIAKKENAGKSDSELSQMIINSLNGNRQKKRSVRCKKEIGLDSYLSNDYQPLGGEMKE